MHNIHYIQYKKEHISHMILIKNGRILTMAGKTYEPGSLLSLIWSFRASGERKLALFSRHLT
jgi:hypothetical protein